jgi:7-cyano-7-deazaguanine synthase
VRLSKADIVREGARLNMPFAETWSCYQGGERHCGRCGTCVERHEAFHLACHEDPPLYEDPGYWIEACREYQAGHSPQA